MAEPKPPTTLDFDLLAAVVYGLTGQADRPLIIECLQTCRIVNWASRNPWPDVSLSLLWFEDTLAELLGLESIKDMPLPSELFDSLARMTEDEAAPALRDHFMTLMGTRLDIARILLLGHRR